VVDAVDELVAKDLLVVEDGQCEFRSDLVREVVYGMLTKADRARRHAVLAQWLEAETEAEPNANSDELLREVARHLATAAELSIELGGIDGVPPDVRGRAVAALQRAGDRAEDRELHVVALRIHDQLVRLLGDEPSVERRKALIGRARAATALRRDAAAVADLDLAEAEAREAGDERRLARALTVRGDLLRNAAEYERSLAALEEARVLWQRVGDRRGEGSALRRIGWTKLFAGDLDAAEPVLLEALDAFREAGALRGQAWAHQNLAWAAYGRGDAELAERRLRDSIDLFRQIGDWGGLNWTNGMLGRVRLAQGEVAEAERHAELALHESREQGDTWQVGMMEVLLASIRLWQGRTEEAVTLGRDALHVFVDLDDEWGQGQASGPLVRALLLTGRFEEADALRTVAMAKYGTAIGFPSHRVFSRLAIAVSAVAIGRPEKALEALADDETQPGDARFGATNLLVARGTALLQLGRVGEAVELLAATAEAAAEPDPRSEALAALALAYAADGRTSEARQTANEVQAMERSYLDRVIAGVAEAAAAAREGDAQAATLAVDRATRLVETTQDRLSAAVVALARARVLEALGDRFAAGAEADARQRFEALGITAPGWDLALRLATGSGVSA
jgi:tetratricopeptide (TPR) repeat protein